MIRGLRQFMKEPTTAELRNPVVLVKSIRTPDGGDGFVTRLEKQYECWAKVIAASGRPLFGESQAPEEELTHVVIIRHAPELPALQIDWKLVHEGRLFAVLDVQWVNQRKFFLAIGLNDNGPLQGRVYDDSRTEENPNDIDNPVAEPPSKHNGFPFWGDDL